MNLEEWQGLLGDDPKPPSGVGRVRYPAVVTGLLTENEKSAIDAFLALRAAIVRLMLPRPIQELCVRRLEEVERVGLFS